MEKEIFRIIQTSVIQTIRDCLNLLVVVQFVSALNKVAILALIIIKKPSLLHYTFVIMLFCMISVSAAYFVIHYRDGQIQKVLKTELGLSMYKTKYAVGKGESIYSLSSIAQKKRIYAPLLHQILECCGATGVEDVRVDKSPVYTCCRVNSECQQEDDFTKHSCAWKLHVQGSKAILNRLNASIFMAVLIDLFNFLVTMMYRLFFTAIKASDMELILP
ncbi:unnamed protein product [Protopolystoma xenopodis]|uniref:Tetraspanin n=1 Tax=Protopolystoma xenopodis TaxID=117903 RepID=A0A3S5C134_9PLAT|nr:unnamed protein product [Protopolystoma xenopodis]